MSNSKRKKILFVDDEPGMRDLVAHGLSHVYDLVTVGSVDAAVSLIKKGRGFDLVVTDIIMPGVGGLSLVGALKEANIPVIVVSGDASGTLNFAKDFGAAVIMRKPLSLMDLEQNIEAILLGLPPARRA